MGGSSHSDSLENRPKIAINQYSYFGVVYHVYSVYILLKVVSCYDFSVLSMHDGFLKKKVGWGVGGWGELYPVLFWIFGIFLTLLSPLVPDGGFTFFNLLTAILISSTIYYIDVCMIISYHILSSVQLR